MVAKSILSKRMLTNIIFLHLISIMLSVSYKLTKHYLTLNIKVNIYALVIHAFLCRFAMFYG